MLQMPSTDTLITDPTALQQLRNFKTGDLAKNRGRASCEVGGLWVAEEDQFPGTRLTHADHRVEGPPVHRRTGTSLAGNSFRCSWH